MKFYYNGKLIRTSKNHHYTHAVITENNEKINCLGCRANRESAESIITERINRTKTGIENGKEMIKALKANKSGYYAKDGRRSYYVRFSEAPDHYTIENAERWIRENEEYIEEIQKTWKVVELEEA